MKLFWVIIIILAGALGWYLYLFPQQVTTTGVIEDVGRVVIKPVTEIAQPDPVKPDTWTGKEHGGYTATKQKDGTLKVEFGEETYSVSARMRKNRLEFFVPDGGAEWVPGAGAGAVVAKEPERVHIEIEAGVLNGQPAARIGGRYGWVGVSFIGSFGANPAVGVMVGGSF